MLHVCNNLSGCRYEIRKWEEIGGKPNKEFKAVFKNEKITDTIIQYLKRK